MHTPPSEAQRLQALTIANHIRTTRANHLNHIKALSAKEGAHQAALLIQSPPEELKGLRLERLARSIHRFGTSRARALLYDVTGGKTWVNPTLGELTQRQRRIAITLLEHHCQHGKKAA